jgi:hypothetical protein
VGAVFVCHQHVNTVIINTVIINTVITITITVIIRQPMDTYRGNRCCQWRRGVGGLAGPCA